MGRFGRLNDRGSTISPTINKYIVNVLVTIIVTNLLHWRSLSLSKRPYV